MFLKVSVIVTTYNWPSALSLVLDSLLSQTVKPFEIIIADDGSTAETQTLIRSYQDKNIDIPIIHMYHADKGFRAAKARNRAVALASGDYLIFLDGDCMVRPHFIKNHIELAESNWFVAGNRILLSETFSRQILTKKEKIYQSTLWAFFQYYVNKQCNRVLPLLSLPLGYFRKLSPQKWRGAKTCNLAMFKEDFVKVNGFNEAFEGWGYEDSDLVIRLLRSGVKRKNGRFKCTVLHLWHKENDRSQEQQNLKQLEQSSKLPIFTEHGYQSHVLHSQSNQQEGWIYD